MDTPITEQDLRREAIRRHLGGEKPRTICDDLKQSPRWFDKWWAEYQHNPPALQGKTVAQMRRGVPVVRLTAELQHLIPRGRLPITAGRIHFMRKVETTGDVNLLNETWTVGPQWMGEYVCATINTAEQVLSFWHKRDAESDWRLVKTRQFRLKEPVSPLLPAFRRNHARCRDYLPG